MTSQFAKKQQQKTNIYSFIFMLSSTKESLKSFYTVIGQNENLSKFPLRG